MTSPLSIAESRIYRGKAPSNIALIKYMGKGSGNQPLNSSLSFSLAHLWSEVEIREDTADLNSGLDSLESSVDLSPAGRDKFLDHLAFLKIYFQIANRKFRVHSKNNFPSDAGLASSASSFAALTMAFRCFMESGDGRPQIKLNDQEWSALSQKGSGSSCRSFFPKWSEWGPEGAHSIEGLPDLHHAVVIIDSRPKTISSSEAHKKVLSSLLFDGRPNRAERRLRELLFALRNSQWEMIFRICWAEFWDMHALFETSDSPFFYIESPTLEVLRNAQQFFVATSQLKHPIRFLVTLDAGPNIHILSPTSLELSEVLEALPIGAYQVLRS